MGSENITTLNLRCRLITILKVENERDVYLISRVSILILDFHFHKICHILEPILPPKRLMNDVKEPNQLTQVSVKVFV